MNYSKKTLVVHSALILIAMLVSYSAARMVRNVFFARTQSESLAQKIEELTQQKQNLETELQELQTKESGEREGKERLNLKKSGEQVVVIVPEIKSDHVQKDISRSFWMSIVSFFGY